MKKLLFFFSQLLCITALARPMDLALTYNPKDSGIGFFGKSWCSALDKVIEVQEQEVVLFSCDSTVPQQQRLVLNSQNEVLIKYKGEILTFNLHGLLLKITTVEKQSYLIRYDSYDRPTHILNAQHSLQLDYDSESTFIRGIRQYQQSQH